VSANRVFAVARRIAQGFRRDERTLGLVFVVPLVITALLGWVLRDQRDTTVSVGIVNQAGLVGDGIVVALRSAAADPSLGIRIVGEPDEAAAREAVRSGELNLALVLPADLLADLQAGTPPTLVVITEGTDPATEAGSFAKLQAVMLRLAGSLAPPGGTKPVIPNIERQTVYLSPDADTVDVLSPIFLGYFGYFFVFLLTGISFLRERIGGTLERLLATPVTRAEIVIGYTIGFGVFATLQIALLTLYVLGRVDVPTIGPIGPFEIGAFTIGLGVQSAGNPVLAFLIALLLSLGAVSLGIFLSTFARTELQVIQFIPIVIVPQGLLGGIFWPIDQLPDVLSWIGRVLPITYAVDGLREVMLKGADLSNAAVQLDLVVLGAIALLFVVLATVTIRREVA
jgi:ABC-2 type transport system permease protein